MELEKTLACWITDRVVGLNAFKDDLAFISAGSPYPYLLITEVSTTKRNLGTGIWDTCFLLNGGESHLQVKAIKEHVVLRFTIRAASNTTDNGNDLVADTCRQIEDLLFELCRSGSIDLPIPDTSPEETIHVERVVFQGRADIAPDEGGEPFVYQKALTYLFVVHRLYEQEISDKFETINIEYDEE